MTDRNCNHEFVATEEKGEWRVKVTSTNNRGTPDDEFVITTIYECKRCGATKEFPDEWEKNYVVPDHLKQRNRKRQKKATSGKKKDGAKKSRTGAA